MKSGMVCGLVKEPNTNSSKRYLNISSVYKAVKIIMPCILEMGKRDLVWVSRISPNMRFIRVAKPYRLLKMSG